MNKCVTCLLYTSGSTLPTPCCEEDDLQQTNCHKVHLAECGVGFHTQSRTLTSLTENPRKETRCQILISLEGQMAKEKSILTVNRKKRVPKQYGCEYTSNTTMNQFSCTVFQYVFMDTIECTTVQTCRSKFFFYILHLQS